MGNQDNISEMEQHIRALKKEVALYKEILDNTTHGIHVIDTKGNIVWANQLTEQIERVSLKDIVGKEHGVVWEESTIWKESPISLADLTILRTLKTEKVSEEQLFSFYDERTGENVDTLVKTFPFHYKGKLEYVYSIALYVNYSEKQLSKISGYRQKFIDQHVRISNNTKYTLYDIIAASPNMLEVITMAQKIAAKDSPVMLYGETGTGKELFAQGIHNASNYNKGKFVAINCAAIPENLIESLLFGTVKGAYTGAENRSGLLEDAEGGTLFLDELNSLPIQVQGKLLRVLQEREASRIGHNKSYQVNCRLISAINQNPQKLVNDNILRMDLYYRLAVIMLEIPPLRKRGEDIFALSMNFIKKFNSINQTAVEQFSTEIWDLFMKYNWPGNVRELEHVIEYMMNFATASQKELTMKELPRYLRPQSTSYQRKPDDLMEKGYSLNQIMDNVRKDILIKVLNKHEWNIVRSAKELGISRENLYHFIKKYELQRPHER